MLIEPDLLKDSDVMHFVDNQGTLSTLIRGAARDGDLAVLASFYQLTCARLGVRAWLEYVESEANIADGPSRVGVQWALSELAKELNVEVKFVPFPELPYLDEVSLRALMEFCHPENAD